MTKTTKTNSPTNKKVPTVADRLKDELEDLNGKISRLEGALISEGFQEKVGVAQYALMCNQLEVMRPYRDIVEARLKLLS